MKTKIIYISGSEVFNMADIRAAFDEVRTTLNLQDTVLFGVPVDCDDALVARAPADISDNAAAPIVAPDIEIAPVQSDVPEMAAQIDAEIEPAKADDEIIPEAAAAIETAPIPVQIERATPEVESAPTPKKSRGRPRKAAAEAVPTSTTSPVTADDNADTEAAPKVIPILSVLAAKEPTAVLESEKAELESEAETEPEIETEAESMTESVVAEADDMDVATIDLADAPISDDDSTSEAPQIVAEAVSITDMIDDDIPEPEAEKTLEQLLESMKPLREDNIAKEFEGASDMILDDDVMPISDADATLAQLATEFAENQDKIPARAQNESHGKIGKLKNILPFKKAKRDDSGLMGDLFGWAGIAANDDDFAIPGFFTTAASKK